MSAIITCYMKKSDRVSKQYIRLGSGHRVGLGHYASMWGAMRTAVRLGHTYKERCDLTHPFTHLNEQHPTQILRQFRDGMHHRINIRGGVMPTGRKTSYEWETAAMRVAQFVNGDPRSAYHPIQWQWIPRELRRAFRAREEQGC